VVSKRLFINFFLVIPAAPTALDLAGVLAAGGGGGR
jgi:hypothetical protein